MIDVDIKLDKRFSKTLAARYEGYELRAGILEDKPHRSALPASRGLTSVGGGPARKKSSRTRGMVSDVAKAVSGHVDYLGAPLARTTSNDMKAFRREFGKVLTGQTQSLTRVETALRAVFRNPILQGKYGRNSRAWAKVKTFNRKLIDTGQFFKSILARVRSKKNVQG